MRHVEVRTPVTEQRSPRAGGRDLVPPPPPADASHRAGLGWADGVDYKSKYRGALLGTAIGDALGRPWEARGAAANGESLESLARYRSWRGWRGGPVGTVTDDTQLTICVAESLCALGRLDPEDLARRFVRWMPEARGPGVATLRAVEELARGVPWDRAGVDSAGNGAAMRVAPIALFHPVDIEPLRHDAAVSAVVTHANQMAVASAIAQAFMVAWCVHRQPHALTGESLRSELLAGLVVVLAGVAESEVRERRKDGPAITRLRDRLVEAFDMRFASPKEAFDHFHNGAFVLESLPAALWCFLRFWDDPRQVILTAVQGGYDADTVASMAGALVGALHGEGALPTAWIEDLEYVTELRGLADSLLTLAAPSRLPAAGPVDEGVSPSAEDGGEDGMITGK